MLIPLLFRGLSSPRPRVSYTRLAGAYGDTKNPLGQSTKGFSNYSKSTA